MTTGPVAALWLVMGLLFGAHGLGSLVAGRPLIHTPWRRRPRIVWEFVGQFLVGVAYVVMAAATFFRALEPFNVAFVVIGLLVLLSSALGLMRSTGPRVDAAASGTASKGSQ